MTSLDRARRFLAAKTAKLALTALPLAVAIPAALGQTGTTGFSFYTNSGCTVYSGSGTCGVEQLSSTGGNPAGNLVDIFSNGAISPDASGSLTIATYGSGSGTLAAGEIIPVAWDFTLTSLGPGSGSTTGPFDVSLQWSLNGESVLTEDLGNLSGGTYLGASSFTFNSGSTTSTPLTSYEIEMVLTNDSSYSLSVPEGTSIDLNASPEPASFLLAGAGLLGLLRRFWRRKAPGVTPA